MITVKTPRRTKETTGIDGKVNRRSKRYRNATWYRDRHGRIRWRFRKSGLSVELGKEWGSEEFKRRYAEAQDSLTSKSGALSTRAKHGTFGDLVGRFYALHFPSLSEATRKDYRTCIEPLREEHGHKRVAHMRRRHVLEIKAALSSTPSQANKTLKRLSQLMNLAVELEWRTDNPVKGVKRYAIEGGGFHTWDEGEIAQFYRTHQFGTAAYLALTLILYTGASRVDVVKLGRGNIKGGRIEYRRQKTRKNPQGIRVSIPIHEELAKALEVLPQNAFTFLETKQGKARTANGLGARMRKWCDEAGLPQCSAHGLRKAICRRLAEAGATAPEIMSVSGHTTLAEVQRYIEAFGRQSAADAAIARLPEGPKAEQNLANHPSRFGEPNAYPLKKKKK